MISIINYGLGNLGSLTNMFKYINVPSVIINDPQQLYSAQKILLPGVGAFDAGITNLHNAGWIEVLNDVVLNKEVPILGICLGMQLMTKSSEEGVQNGLGWIDATVHKFPYSDNSKLKIPHMGWNTVSISKTSPLFPQQQEENRFYFVHSYFVKLASVSDEMLQTTYGIGFTSGFSYRNIIGVQFHPEKSHKYGIRFLQRFATL